jgi:hypothetical protein
MVSQLLTMSDKDKTSVSGSRLIRVKEDGVPPTNPQPTQNNSTNMVSTKKMREMQKKKESGCNYFSV